MKKQGFSTKKYLDAQIKAITDRVKKFNGRLYLEFGGKLCYDHHATRVLPGYEVDPRIKAEPIQKGRPQRTGGKGNGARNKSRNAARKKSRNGSPKHHGGGQRQRSSGRQRRAS